ncbi:MAG: hypothetical protein D6685_03435 [Bacteroidetes bacterium]|nr:hypothetical protein AWN76_000770 [Rhodothermaceae bacterium RA]RMH67535.1 MAG: hypothetical protein D6685_03435 [Bacteroidota bacterium]
MKTRYPLRFTLPDEDMPPALRRYLEKLYLNAWSAYADAGCPFGLEDEAMLIWLEFDQQTQPN